MGRRWDWRETAVGPKAATHEAAYRVVSMYSGVSASQPGAGELSLYILRPRRLRQQGRVFTIVAFEGVVNLCHIPACRGGDLSYAVLKHALLVG